MTLLIRNIQLIYGDGRPVERGEIFVRGDTITALGKLPRMKADETIDGKGAYLAPGFIDVDTASDHYLSFFHHPSQNHFLLQGVTTAIGGHCGASLAPLLYGDLNSFDRWSAPRGVNVDWHSLAELRSVIASQSWGVHFGTFIGQETVRRALTGDEARKVSKNELMVAREVFRRALKEGGMGISMRLGNMYPRKLTQSELVSYLGVVREEGGIGTLHAEEDAPLKTMETALTLSKKTGTPILITHFLPQKGTTGEYIKALELLDSSNAAVYFSLYPFGWSERALTSLMPEWAQGTLRDMQVKIGDEWLARKIEASLSLNSFSKFIVAEAPHNHFLVGKTLSTIQEFYETKTVAETILALMRATKLQAVVLVDDIDEGELLRALAHPRALVGSHAHSFVPLHKSSAVYADQTIETFPHYLSLSHGAGTPIEKAVERVTLTPARLLGLANRGLLKNGAHADIVVFQGKEIKWVLVDGKVAVRNGAFTGVQNGRFIERTPWH